MVTIHWLGAGLSSVPGIRRLAHSGRRLVLWNRTLSKASAALAGWEGNATATARRLDWRELNQEVAAGDVLVSMLPASMHMQVAELCLANKAHFVSTSYVSPEMRVVSARAAAAGLSFVNEVGLDPGLDHLLAHALVAAYKDSEQFDTSRAHYFRSYCGGVPKVPNEFKYKFSWSPLGVLRALKSPASWIGAGQRQTTDKPWKSLTEYSARLPVGSQTFQAYPNRDSLPFMAEYGFADDWNVPEFVRGTLRLDGWAAAWQEIFDLVEAAGEDEEGRRLLEAKSEELWSRYSYEADEPDRVVLCVELEVRQDDEPVWHQMYSLDECGGPNGSAMARLVSWPASIAVESVVENKMPLGVSPAPRDAPLVIDWLAKMADLGVRIEHFELVPDGLVQARNRSRRDPRPDL